MHTRCRSEQNNLASVLGRESTDCRYDYGTGPPKRAEMARQNYISARGEARSVSDFEDRTAGSCGCPFRTLLTCAFASRLMPRGVLMALGPGASGRRMRP